MQEEQVIILRLLGGCAAALMLDTALDYDLFGLIKRGIDTADAISKSTNTNKNALSIFLDALYALGFLQKEAERYLLNPISEAYMVRESPHYIGDFRYIALCSNEGLKGLYQTIKTGKTRAGFEWENKPRGLILLVEPLAKFLSERISKPGSTLIYGPSAGIFAYYLLKKSTGLDITCIDLPRCNEISKQYFLAKNTSIANINFIDKDFLNGPLWQPPKGVYDTVILTNILHFVDEVGQKTLLEKVQSISPKGSIFVSDFFVNRERTGPRFPLLFRLYLLACTERGDVPCAEILSSYLKEQGFMVSFYNNIPDAYDGAGILEGRR